ncbi:MAG TPA: acetyl-CoA carboxylase biotin carboxyl carrier protein [Solibacterales bacterium]|nr:acetyl-CoA carboxylase biotin carboxyl carrier protein [Bryobacterales bacterium]
MTIEEIRELIQAVLESGVAELEVQRGDSRVRIRRQGRPSTAHPAEYVVAGASAPAPVQSTGPMAGPASTPPNAFAAASAAAPALAAADPAADPSLVLVKSPIVGTFYESPSPGSAPFVRIGEAVQPGKVLCIIESMKLMNEIEAELSGTVVHRLVENGAPVEYGEALFAIRPA